MTRKPAYPGQEEHLRNVGVIHTGAEAAIKGTRPGSPKVHDPEAERDAKAAAKAAMKEARRGLGPARHNPAEAEWDNPLAKRQTPQHEQMRRVRIRIAQIEAASDPGNPVDRAAIIRRDDKTCWICKKRLQVKEIELDHIIPLSRGGKHIPENVKVACKSCNAWKGDRIISVL
jgi:5-methylcytosine-specific restriction endonuclease McrA